jgi:hypothetical protein
MNVEIGTEAALFPEKEHINGIFLAVWQIQLYYAFTCEVPSSPDEGFYNVD